MVPESVGRYQIFAKLGAGGFATVYRAHDPLFHRDVAIKVLHPHLAHDAAIRRRFVREARTLAGVRHPNLVRLLDAGEAGGVAYLAMEYVAGRPLSELAAEGPLPLPAVVRIVEQIAGALEALHAAGLVHRDVKPANILLADDGRAVLLDLGIARALDGETATSPSLILGTPGYLAPEQVRERGTVGPATDVYQLAATAYALLSGEPPFAGTTARVLYAIAHEPAPDLGGARPDLPPYIAEALGAALAKDPGGRPATPAAFAARLAGAHLPRTLRLPAPPAPAVAPAARVPAGPTASGRAPERSHRAGRSGWRSVVLAAALVLGLTAGGVGLFSMRAADRPAANAAATPALAPATVRSDATATPGRRTPSQGTAQPARADYGTIRR